MTTDQDEYSWLNARIISALFPAVSKTGLHDGSEELPAIIGYISKNVADVELSINSPEMRAKVIMVFKLVLTAKGLPDNDMASWDDELFAAFFKLNFSEFKQLPLETVMKEVRSATENAMGPVNEKTIKNLEGALKDFLG